MTDSLKSQADSVINSQPEPSPHAIESEERERLEKQTRFSHLKDKWGRTFDPSLHRVDSDGSPVTNKRDGLLSIKPGRGTREAKTGPRSEIGTVPGKTSPGSTDQQRRAAAAYTVEAIQMIGFAVGGEDWAYKKDSQTGVDERLFGIEAFDKYYEAKGVTDIPPGIAIVLWGIMYASPRLAQSEPTKNRLKAAYYWIRSKFSRRKKSNGTRVDSGNDGKRENESRG